MTKNGRDTLGRFTVGNPGGPGRPKRAVELEYLAALADCVSIDDWRAVCLTSVELAKAGDPKAREWLASHLLGAQPATLSELAFNEALGINPALLIQARALKELDPTLKGDSDFSFGGEISDIALARKLAEAGQAGDGND